jgi:hypothetical protein
VHATAHEEIFRERLRARKHALSPINNFVRL